MKHQFDNYSNEDLLDHFDICCSEWTKAVNYSPKTEKKWAKAHAEAKAELLRRLNKDE